MGPSSSNSDGSSSMQKMHRAKLEQIRSDAVALAGTAVRISQAVDEVLDKGGVAQIQPQMAFLTSALARLSKDWGVIEYLQSLGTTQRKLSQR